MTVVAQHSQERENERQRSGDGDGGGWTLGDERRADKSIGHGRAPVTTHPDWAWEIAIRKH